MSLFVDEDEQYIDDVGVVETTSFENENVIQNFHNDGEQDNHDNEVEEEFNSIPVVREPEVVEESETEHPVSCSLPLKYQQSILEEMLTKDGLLILGRGLGWEPIIANLLHALSTPTLKGKRPLIILLQADTDENGKLTEELNELNWVESMQLNSNKYSHCPFIIINNDATTADKRSKIYERGGVISITERVLVVDLLSGVLEAKDITGIVVLHAERVNEKLKTSFILNLYRDGGNDWGFIKAITDQPETFYGFTPLQTKLKDLRVKNVLLWPRFHVAVMSSLSSKEFNSQVTKRVREEESKGKLVTEINVKMTYKMTKIQNAILACLQACIGELKRHNPLIATEYWDIENIHDKKFIDTIHAMLYPNWHRISWTSKKLVEDLKTLKKLLGDLIKLDSLTFYKNVQWILNNNLRPTSRGLSMQPWLNLDESSTVISYAKERALGKLKISAGPAEGNSVLEEEYVLEELPKWDQLGILLDDIMHEKEHKDNESEGPILIMCSPGTSGQLKNIISSMQKEENRYNGKRRFSCRKYMVRDLVYTYIPWKETVVNTKKISTELRKDGDEDDVVNIDQTDLGSKDGAENEELNTSKTFTRGKGFPTSKRRRTRGAAAVANVHRLHSASEANQEVVELDPAVLKNLKESTEIEDENEGGQFDVINIDDEDIYENMEDNDDIIVESGGFISSGNQKFEFSHINLSDQIIIEEYNEMTNDTLLQELSPSYIILYEADVSFIRRVEIHQAINKSSPAKAFFMYYGGSVEEQTFLLRIKKEKEAFVKLIREKASLSKHFETSKDNYKFQIQKSDVINTRIAGGANFRTELDEFKVIVDAREFNSALPNILYRAGFKVIPSMLTVGDYIISPKICIERKGLEDLKSSFKDGRLFNQCEQMFRHYELPCLLIEFDESDSFSMQPFGDFKNYGSSNVQGRKNKDNNSTKVLQHENIQSKIMLLLVAYPKLKIIWSSSPYETAQILAVLKSNQDEPDISSAISKGLSKNNGSSEPPMYNDDAIDLIQKIPGINSNNYYQIISKIKCIEDLVKVSEEKLKELLGEENGRKAHYFIHKKIV